MDAYPTRPYDHASVTGMYVLWVPLLPVRERTGRFFRFHCEVVVLRSVPAESLAVPAESLAVPAESLAVPAESLAVPAESLAVPAAFT
jgi:hypothetical protein